MAVFKPNVQKLVATRNIDGLINAARYNDPSIRRNAIKVMAQFRDPRVYQVLINALRDESRVIRVEAIMALGKLRETSFAIPLQWSLKDSDPTVRMNAVWAMGQIGGPEVVKPLILSMADADKRVRIKAVETVTSIIDIALPELNKALCGRNQLVRQNVINVLGKTKQVGSVPDLIRALNDPVTKVRENAIWALGNIGDPRALPALEKMRTKRAAKSLRQIREGPHWKTVADNYEKAGRYEDAAKLHEMKSQWEEAGRLRNKAKEPVGIGAVPQIVANNLNLRQDTIIRDSVISRSRIGKGQAKDSVIHRSDVHGKDLRNEVIGRPTTRIGGLTDQLDNELDDDLSDDELSDEGGTKGTELTADGYRICPFCGKELKFEKAPAFCPYCAEHL